MTFSLLMSVPAMHGGVAIELALAQTISRQEIAKKLKFSKVSTVFANQKSPLCQTENCKLVHMSLL